MKNVKALSLLTAVLLLGTAVVETVQAIPAFARRYKLSCSTCHAPMPKLKPFGDDFAASGFILKEEEKERDYITAGDDLLWLNKSFPVAARFDAFGVYRSRSEVKSDLQTPYGLKLLSGGTLYKNIGYYFYFYMAERGEVAGIEDAYIHFDDVFGSGLDIMVGQFQACDPLMKRELRLTYEDYQIYRVRVGQSFNNLTYDRGILLNYGVEKTGTDLTAMIVNGNGKPEAAGGSLDRDTDKNAGLRLAQKITEGLCIGGFYYRGSEAVIYPLGKSVNHITYYGPDLNVQFGPLEFTGQYLVRRDDNPLFFHLAPTTLTKGIVAELIYSPRLDRSRWFVTALYNRVTSELDDVPLNLEDLGLSPLAYHTATLSGTVLLSRNLRLLAEYTRDLEHKADRFAVGFVTAY